MQRLVKKSLLSILMLAGVITPLAAPLPTQAQQTPGSFCEVEYQGPTGWFYQKRQGTFNSQGRCVDAAGNDLSGLTGLVRDRTGNLSGQHTPSPSCDITSPSSWDLCVSNIIYVFSVGLGSTFAFFGAYFFDVAVSLALNSAAYAQSFISQGWSMARDLANMGFILALVYIAYTIILKAETSGTIRMLAWVIIVALIINFSFFFTRLVIDAGNILAVQFYNAIDAQTLDKTLSVTTGGSTATGAANWVSQGTLARTKDLTHPIMTGLAMQNLFNTTEFDAWYNNLRGAGGFMTALITLSLIYIAVGAMYFILAVMFLTAGVKFLTRVVVLWFLIIVSPLAFLAKTTNISERYYDLWQSKLINHVFYPVVFMFIFLFIVLVMESLNPGNASGGLINSLFTDLRISQTNNSGILTIIASVANVAIRLGFVVAMLYIGMKAADTVGVYGANAAKKFTGWASGRVIGLGRFGLRYGPGWAAGAAYRHTGGRVANWAGEKLTASTWANRTGTLGGVIGYRLNRDILQPMKKTSLGTVATSWEQREDFLKKRREHMEGNLGNIKAREDAQQAKILNDYEITAIDAGLKKAKEDKEKYRKEDESILEGDIERRGRIKSRETELQEKAIAGTMNAQEEADWKLIRTDLQAKKDAAQLNYINATSKVLEFEDRKRKTESSSGKSWEQLQSENETYNQRIAQLSNAQLTSLKASDLEGVIKQISESQLKAIKESGKYLKENVDALTKKWHEENKKAPIGKSKEEIEKLDKIHDDLRGLGINIKTIQERGGTTPSGDTIVTLKAAKDTKGDLEEEKRRQEELKETVGAGPQRKDIQIRINQLTKAIKRAETTVENLEKVPEKVGGRDAPGEFIIKKT